MSYGEKLQQLRKGRDWSQERLAEEIPISRQAVSKWEGDVCCPDIQLLPALADALGLSLDALFGREAPEPPKEERPAEEVKVETAPIGIVEKLPWADDDSLHAVLYQGHRLLQSGRGPERSGSGPHRYALPRPRHGRRLHLPLRCPTGCPRPGATSPEAIRSGS